VKSVQQVAAQRRTAILLGAAVGLISVCACSSQGSTAAGTTDSKLPSHFVIGADLPLTGPAAAYGASMQRGVQLAVDYVNSTGGIDGKKLVVDSQDTATADSAAAVTAYQQNVAAGSFAVNTCFLQNSAAQAAQAKRSNVPVTSGCLGDNTLVGLPWFYNVTPTVDQEIQVLLDYAHSQGINRISAVIDQANYDTTPASLSAGWKKAGASGPANGVLIPPGTTDPTPQIQQALATKPQALVLLAVGTLGQTVVTDLGSQGVTIPIYGNIAVGAYAQAVQKAKLNMTYTNSLVKTTSQWQALFKKYYPKTTPELWDSSFYTSTMIMVEALKAAIKAGYGMDGSAVQKALGMPNAVYSGAGGVFKFGPGHTAPGVFQVLHSSNGSAFAQVATETIK